MKRLTSLAGFFFTASCFMRVHFGLGASKTANRLEVQWPSGTIDVFENIERARTPFRNAP